MLVVVSGEQSHDETPLRRFYNCVAYVLLRKFVSIYQDGPNLYLALKPGCKIRNSTYDANITSESEFVRCGGNASQATVHIERQW